MGTFLSYVPGNLAYFEDEEDRCDYGVSRLTTENRQLKFVFQRVLYTLPVIWLVVSLVFV